MYTLCGQTFPGEPAIWLPLLIASGVFIVPTLMPWRKVAMLVCAIMLGIVALMLVSAFVSTTEDICDPPYFQTQFQQLSLVAAGTLAIVSCFFLKTGARPISWGTPVQWGWLGRQYAIALIPAVIAIGLRLI